MASARKPLRRVLRGFAQRTLLRLTLVQYWLSSRLVIGVIRLVALLPVDRALNASDRLARRLGPLLGRHRTTLDNLRRAFPEKPEAELEAIALEMWGGLGRLALEYVFLDQLVDFQLDRATPGRVEVEGVEIFRRIAGDGRPHILFTGHLGNFELLPVVANRFGLKLAALFRPPNNPYIAEYVLRQRQDSMGALLASRAGVTFALAGVLAEGGNVGVLVDQKLRDGIETVFFGQPCQTTPLPALLARRFDCDIYPARCVRLPGGRFRLVIEDRLVLARDEQGRLDVPAVTQQLTDVVERWVREFPGQWMWLHKRWKITRFKHLRRGAT